MSKPTVKVITGRLTRAGVAAKHKTAWATFLHGLDWDMIKPVVQMAHSAHVHPAIAAGMVIRSTQDDQIKATLQAHLEAKHSEHQPQDAEAATGQHCENCGCCLASECVEGACDTKGTGPQWCPCAVAADEQAHLESKAGTQQQGTAE